MKKVVYYARVSTGEEGQQFALKNQIGEIEDYVDKQEDWELVDKYIDEGKSGTSTKSRNEYNRLYRDLLSDKFDIVLVKDESRLNRNPLNWYLFIDRLLKNEKQLFFTMTETYYKPDDEFIMTVKAGMASQYSRDLSKKIYKAHQRRMEKGRVVTNGRIWGYYQKDGELHINEEQAEVVRYIFRRYIEGAGFRTIQQELYNEGITNQNGGPFSHTTLKRMIRNPKYKGTLVMNTRTKDFDTGKFKDNPPEEWIIHEDAVPAIVSKETWEKAQEVLDSKRKKHGIGKQHEGKGKEQLAGYFSGKYPLSGKIVCAKCGQKYWHAYFKPMKNDIWICSTYRTHGKKHNLGCDNDKISAPVMDQLVKEVIFDFWQNKETSIDKVIQELDKLLEKTDYESTIKKLTGDKMKYEQKKDKLLEMYTEGLIDKKEFQSKKEEYESHLVQLDERIREFEDRNKKVFDKKRRMEEVKKVLDQKVREPKEINERMVERFIKEIKVFPNNNVEIFLHGDFQYLAEMLDNDDYEFQRVSDKGPDPHAERFACRDGRASDTC